MQVQFADLFRLTELFYLSFLTGDADAIQQTISQDANEWMLINVIVTSFVLIILLIISFFLFSFFYYPYPHDIADRYHLIIFDALLRLGNEYLGEIVETIFGAEYRNKLLRIIFTIPRLFHFSTPNWLTIRNEIIGNVKVRVYYPKKRRSNAVILHMHGGGWTSLKPVDYDNHLLYFIKRLDMLIISINYRRSPEYHYPIPAADCEAVYRELVTIDYKRYGIDPTKIFLLGDSAGGNLAAVIAQRQLKANFQQPKSQILIYPAIHPFDFLSPSYQQFYKSFPGCAMLNPRMMVQWYLHYLGIPVTKENTKKLLRNEHMRSKGKQADNLRSLIGHNLLPDSFIDETYNSDIKKKENDYLCDTLAKYYHPDLAPIIDDNLEGLCKTMVITVGYDILRDEGLLYVRRLQSFNVSVLWKHYSKLYHGCLNMPFSNEKRKIFDDIVAFIELQLCKDL